MKRREIGYEIWLRVERRFHIHLYKFFIEKIEEFGDFSYELLLRIEKLSKGVQL